MPRNTRAQQIKLEHWAEIERAYLAGVPYTKIAEQLEVSPRTVAKWLCEEGLRHKGRGRYPKAMHAKVRKLYKQGWSEDELSVRLNITEERIEFWLKNKPKPVPRSRQKNPAPKNSQLSQRAQRLIREPEVPRHKPRTLWSEKQKKYVLSLMKRNMTVLEVYRITGASKARQSKIWHEAGNKNTPPNFPSREETGKVKKKKKKSTIRKAKKEQVEQLRADLNRAEKQLERERRERRQRALTRRRHEAEESHQALVQSPEELEAAQRAAPIVTPRALPPSRQSQLPRPKK